MPKGHYIRRPRLIKLDNTTVERLRGPYKTKTYKYPNRYTPPGSQEHTKDLWCRVVSEFNYNGVEMAVIELAPTALSDEIRVARAMYAPVDLLKAVPKFRLSRLHKKD